MMAAIEAGPSMATVGSQVCRGKTGALTAKPSSSRKNTAVCSSAGKGVAEQGGVVEDQAGRHARAAQAGMIECQQQEAKQ